MCASFCSSIAVSTWPFSRSYVDDSATLAADIDHLIRAAKRRHEPDGCVLGLITLTHGPAMVSIRPILTTREDAPSRGSLILVRDLGPQELDTLAHLTGVLVTLSGVVGDSAEVSSDRLLQSSDMSIVASNEDGLSVSTMLNDIWQKARITLRIQHDRSVWLQGQQTLAGLMLVLIAVGFLFACLNVWIMHRLVVRRVERLIRLTKAADSDAGLTARVRMRGSDEIAQLGHRMNQMLEHLQISHDKLLSAQERLRFEATHDGLTGIWNRSAALQLLDQELARSTRDGSSVAVIMFDADHFKRINDHFGHSTGDWALKAIAAAITRNLRGFDVCCRYGGEEFLVIAPHCNLNQGAQLAQRILKNIRETPVSVRGHSFCVTLSAGVTAGVAPCRAEDLIMMADKALHRAKDNGRDRVETQDICEHLQARDLAASLGDGG